jgi:hypothetical protein
MKKPAIPPAPKPGEDRGRFDQSIKESMEVIMGRRGDPIALLDPATATAEDCANKINEMLALMQ